MSNAATPAGTGGSGTGADNPGSGAAPDSAEIQKLVQDAVSKALGPRLQREREREAKERQEAIEKMVTAAIEKLGASQTAQQQQQQQPAQPDDKLAAQLKAYSSQIEALKKQMEEAETKRVAAEEKERDNRVRSTVRDALVKQMGAENPHLSAYLTMLHDVGKRFVDIDGEVFVKFKNGDIEDTKTLDDGVKELFKTELKHLAESRTQSMPARTPRGQAMQSQQPTNNRLDNLFNRVVQSIPLPSDDPGLPK